nr:hypothetical protein [uncultured Mediterraneibacter sp.]
MARYVQDVTLNKPDDFVAFIVNDYLQKNKFAMADWKGEPAYRAGDGMLEGFKYLKWSYEGGVFHLEAWLQGTAGGEWDLEGVVGAMMKKPYKKSLEQLLDALHQEIPAQNAAADQNSAAQPNPQPIPVRTVDNTGAATATLVLGILSIPVGLLLPLVGIIIGGVGISQARMGLGSSKANLAKAGKILSIIGICVSALIWLLNIILTVALL